LLAPSRRRLHPGQRVRALVVDDSAVLRRLVIGTLEQDPEIEVVGSAPNGAIALERIARLHPDVVSLDIDMPEMDGIETLKRIRRDFPLTRVVMFSSYTERGAATTFEALSEGADDYVAKTGSEGSTETLRESLLPKIKQFFFLSHSSPDSLTESTVKDDLLGPIPAVPEPTGNAPPQIVAIGVSTGGPEALSKTLSLIPQGFDLPILIVQHMPPLFTRFLCERLQERTSLPVREARHGEKLTGPRILIAPGDFHMRLGPELAGSPPEISLDKGPAENSCRPAVDVLFRSVAERFKAAALAIVMTGMGQDGLRGAKAVKSRGGFVIAQDEGTSVVWGMPRAVAEAHLADLVLPLDQIIPETLRYVARFRKADHLTKDNAFNKGKL
jgi:two-component system chemotaxis response regulator CheB